MRLGLAALIFADLAVSQTTAPVVFSGTITDAVTNQPIAGAQISYCCGDRGAAATSDAKGSYSLRVATSETRGSLNVSKPGYASLDETFPIRPGATENRNFELNPAAVISGRLIDADTGRPLAGFSVQASGEAGVFKSRDLSDADGQFSIIRLGPGDYIVEADPPLREIAADSAKPKPNKNDYSRTWFANSSNAEAAAIVRLPAGDNRRIEIALQKRELHHISGVIQAPEGRNGAAVRFLLSVRAGDTFRTIAAGRIPGAGSFRIDGVDRGEYRIFAAGDRTFAGEPVQVTDRDIENLKLTLRPGVILRPAVSMAEENTAVPDGLHLVPLPVTLDSNDRLIPDLLPPGEYWPALIAPPGYAVVSATYNGRPVANDAIDVEGDSTVSFVLTSRPSGITGTVRDADQKPIPGATVILLPEALPENFERFDPRARHSATADSSGGFRFSDLAPGRYKAVGITGGDRRRAHDLPFLRDSVRYADPIVLEAGGTITRDVAVQ